MWFWMYVISGWIVCLVMMPILSRRYTPAKAWAWLVLMFLLPWIGLGLYLLFGENPLGRRRVVGYQQIARALEEKNYLGSLDEHVVAEPTEGRFGGLERVAVASGAMRPVGGNDLELITDLPESMDRLIKDVDRAEHHVHMIVYIFHDDRTGRRVAEALGRAASRGVKCRLMVDAVGGRDMFGPLSEWMERQGVEVRKALPLNPFRSRSIRLDVRNHRKIIVIDGRLGYTGSGNVTNPDYGFEVGEFRELMARVRGPIVAQLQLAFLEDWCRDVDEAPDDPALFPEPRVAGSSVAHLLPSGPMYPYAPLRDVAVTAIHGARRRVMITTPYLVPDETFMTAVRLAVLRGVRVELIFAIKNDRPIAASAAWAYFRNLVLNGVAVYLYKPAMLHTKLLTVDGEVGMIGSGNFDIRSFRLNVEANVLVYSNSDIARLVALQEGYIEESDLVDEQTLRNRPWTKQVLGDCAKLLSPLM